MCFRVTKTSGRGAPPDPRTTFRAPQAGRPTWSVLRKRVRSRTAWLPPATTASRPLRGDAEQPGGQPVGQRVRRRLEAALDTLPGRIACLGATRGGGGGGAQTRPAPNPQQALGLPGRSQPRPRVPCGPGRPEKRRARPWCARASAAPPVRMSGAPGCASAPHVVFAGVCGPDPGHWRGANHR